MPLIHRYLLKQFIRVFLIFFISFTGLYIVIDAFNNLEELIDYGNASGGLVMALFSYYSPRALFFFDRASGMLILIAAMFTIASFQRHNELTALLAAGISEIKVVKPLIVAAVCLSVVAVVNRELFIPSVRASLNQDAQDLVSNKPQEIRATYDNETLIHFSGNGAIVKDRVILKPNFSLPKELALYGNDLRAERAVYEPPQEGRPGGYRLIDVQDQSLGERPSLGYAGHPVILTPHDTPWLRQGEAFVVSDVTFEMLAGGGSWRQYSSTLELISAVKNPSLDYGANMRVAIHGRVVQPFLDVTLFFLGLPLVLTSKNHRNKLAAIGKSALLMLVFTGVVLGCQALGNNYLLNPALAAWLPLIVFAPAAIWMFDPLRDRLPKRPRALAASP